MNDNRRQILDMLAAGQITADEAERLLSALEKEPAGAAAGANGEARPKAKPKYLRVVVQSNEGSADPVQANIRVPMQLLRAGVRLASLIPVQARIHVNEAMREHGMQMDLNQIKPENLEEIVDQLDELTVDVDQKNSGTKVRVYCE